jgi:hypothetical protein
VTNDESLFTDDFFNDCFSPLGNDDGINPATGLPMTNSMIDVGGNFYGMSDDSMSIGTEMDSDFGIDSFDSSDNGFL